MNINRYNYEEYFLLYLDNELSLTERRAVESFVEKNADLQKELLALQQSTLSIDKNIVFNDKKALLRFTSDEQSININNYEQFFIYYLDDELSRHEKAAVEQFIYRHPEFQEEFELIQQLRLSPESVTCPDKKGLYRFDKEQPVILPWWRIAAAAVILFIAATIWLNTQPFSELDKPVAKHTIRKAPGVPGNKKHSYPQNGITVLTENKPAETTGRVEVEKALPDKNLADKKGYTNKKVESNADQAYIKVSMQPVVVGTAALTSQQEVNTMLASGKIDRLPAAGKLMNEPASTDELTSVSYFAADASEANRKDEHTFLTNIPIDGRGPLRKVFRKASRLLDRTAALSSQRKSGIVIGNIEIALQ